MVAAVYTSASSIGLTGALTLNGAGNADTNTVSRPSCAAVVATTTTTVVGTTTTTTVPQVIPPIGPVTSGQGTAVGSRARISELEQVSMSALAGKPLAKSIPRSLQIPAIGVNTNLVGLGLTKDGALEVTKSNFPTKTVYGNIDFAGLRLITCGGYSIHTGRNEKNVVVYAELFGSSARSHRYY